MCLVPPFFPSSERDKEKQDPVPPKLGMSSGWDWLMLNPGGLHDVLMDGPGQIH